MSIIVALFMGLSVSAEEIIRDRKILKRESFLHLSWNSYLLSKLVVLFFHFCHPDLQFHFYRTRPSGNRMENVFCLSGLFCSACRAWQMSWFEHLISLSLGRDGLHIDTVAADTPDGVERLAFSV